MLNQQLIDRFNNLPDLRRDAIKKKEALELRRKQFIQNFFDGIGDWVRKIAEDVVEVAELEAASLSEGNVVTSRCFCYRIFRYDEAVNDDGFVPTYEEMASIVLARYRALGEFFANVRNVLIEPLYVTLEDGSRPKIYIDSQDENTLVEIYKKTCNVPYCSFKVSYN